MSGAIKFKAEKIRRETRRLIFAWLMLCLLALDLSPAFAAGQQAAKSSDLVYCPIQKLWVEKYVPPAPPVKIKEPLTDICASNKEKNQFFFEVSKIVPLLRFIPNSDTAEKLFFDYIEKGKQALTAAFTAPQNAPERGIEKANAERKAGAGSFQNNFDRSARADIFTLPQAARPPTAPDTAFSVFTAASFALEDVSCRIKPRAPPVSI